MDDLNEKQKFWIGASVAALGGTCWWLLQPREGYFDKWAGGDINEVLPDLDPKVDDEQIQQIAMTVKQMLLDDARQQREAQDAELEALSEYGELEVVDDVG